jgi:hypothetical protein
MTSLQLTEGVDKKYVAESMRAYVKWVTKMQALGGDFHAEPKWNIGNETPYGGGWCRPQTDGPALRARALMLFGAHIQAELSQAHQDVDESEKLRGERDAVWKLIKFDLDWLSASRDRIQMSTCKCRALKHAMHN